MVSDSSDSDPAPVDAVARLELSRLRLRKHLLELNGSKRDAQGAAAWPSSSVFDSVKSIPLVGVVMDTVSSWWAQHPLRVVATLLTASAASAARPVTQRHPRWTLFAALAVGGLVMWVRPWRFAMLRRVVYAGLLPQFISKVMSSMPADGWLNLADSLLNRGKTSSPASGKPTEPAAPRNSPSRSESAQPTPLH